MNLAERLSNTQGWVYLIILLGLVAIVYMIAKSAFTSYDRYNNKREWKRERNRMFFFVFLFILYVFFFFLNFGNKEESSSVQTVEDTQEYKRLQEKESEMTPQEINKDAEEQKTKELRIQSDDSLRKEYLKESEKKSDEVIKEYLKKI